MKIIRDKKFSSLLAPDEIFYHWIFSSSVWFLFQLNKKPLHIKWKSVKETVVYVLLSLQGMRWLEKNGSSHWMQNWEDNESQVCGSICHENILRL